MGSKKRASSDKDSKSSKKPRTEKYEKHAKHTTSAFINADATDLDPTLSSLFTARAPPASDPVIEQIVPSVKTPRSKQVETAPLVEAGEVDSDDDNDNDDDDDDDDGTLSSISEELNYSSDEDIERVEVVEEPVASEATVHISQSDDTSRRRRKHKDDNDNLEAEHLSRVAREADKAAEKARPHRPATSDIDMSDAASSDSDNDTKIPQHISLQQDGDDDMQKAQRTVFVSNVSTTAIKSKSARKELMTHMSSFFFSSVAAPPTGQPSHAIESIRFRSTAYAGKIPKKAAYAKKELMDETTLSTNAYVVYSSPTLARQAAISLNGTVTLDRHIHVDEVAHPAKVDHHKCIFVGNLGFVDDESRIDAANAEDGRQVRRGRKTPSDIEEGLWRTFSKCGSVTNVRVVRDSKTRVGKGIAYVQFSDENAVEAALLYNDKKFPPMLPRKLRVSRAKAHKRNARPGADSTRNVANANTAKLGKKGGYVPKMTPEQQSQLGRANRLLGSQAAMRMRTGKGDHKPTGIRAPESFVFEGHRASQQSGGAGGSNKKPKGKPTGRGAKRASAWKAGNRAKAPK